MQRHSAATLLLAFLALFAGQVVAQLNITIGGSLGVIRASQLLDVNVEPFTQDCQSLCQPGIDAIQSCGDFNATCLCSSETVTEITACQQCWYNDIIKLNAANPSDPRIGSSAPLTAYQTACANVTTIPASEIALTLPSDWDGPFGQGLNTAGTVIVVGAAMILGAGCITVVNTM